MYYYELTLRCIRTKRLQLCTQTPRSSAAFNQYNAMWKVFNKTVIGKYVVPEIRADDSTLSLTWIQIIIIIIIITIRWFFNVWTFEPWMLNYIIFSVWQLLIVIIRVVYHNHSEFYEIKIYIRTYQLPCVYTMSIQYVST